MRRYKPTYIVAALVMAVTFVFASVSMATHPGHVFDANFTPNPPKGFPKGKPQPGALHIELGGADDPATPLDPTPPKATSIAIDLDKSIKVDGSKLPVCTANLESTPATGPGSATELCGDALAGTGSAQAQIGTTVLDGTGLIFNGANNTLIVHIRVDAISTTTIVVGSIVQSPDQSLYGQRLSFPSIPILAGGAGALKGLTIDAEKIVKKKGGKAATASKKKKKKKKYISLVTGKCTDGVFNFANLETYSDHEPINEPIQKPCTK